MNNLKKHQDLVEVLMGLLKKGKEKVQIVKNRYLDDGEVVTPFNTNGHLLVDHQICKLVMEARRSGHVVLVKQFVLDDDGVKVKVDDNGDSVIITTEYPYNRVRLAPPSV